MGRVGTPSIRILLTILVSQDRLETATMQIELDDVSRGEANSGQGREKELINQAIASHSNGGLGSSGCMRRNNHPTAMSLCGNRDLPTIKYVPARATFWMGELLVSGQGEALLDLHQIRASHSLCHASRSRLLRR